MKYILSVIICIMISGNIHAQDSLKVYDYVPNPPTYEGGMNEFYRFIMMNIKYPSEARIKNEWITGKVYVEFIVNSDGAIVDESIKVVRSVHESLDNEAIRLIKMCPDSWIPAKLDDGSIVNAKMIIPISFQKGK